MGLTYKCLMSWDGCLLLAEGYSVNKVIEACEKATARRPGAPARLVASSQKIYEELGWKAEYLLEPISGSVWEWHQRKGSK